MEFLEFEVPIKEILDQIEKCKSIENESDVDITKTYNLLQKKLVEAKKDVYGNIEGLIDHFKLVMEGHQPPAGEVYMPIEGGNGDCVEEVVAAAAETGEH